MRFVFRYYGHALAASPRSLTLSLAYGLSIDFVGLCSQWRLLRGCFDFGGWDEELGVMVVERDLVVDLVMVEEDTERSFNFLVKEIICEVMRMLNFSRSI